jgi:hypothetical protein
MKNKLLHILIFFITFSVLSQERQMLYGKIVVNDSGLSEVYVINKTTGTEVKTDYNGLFQLSAKPGDRIVMYNTKIIVREFNLLSESFNESPYVISVSYNAYELEELVINKYDKINAESLGLVPKGQKRRTVAERRLYTAGAFTVGTVIGLDPIINAISGRTRMLRKAYETEKKESVINNIRGIYNEDEITRQYNVPAEQVEGFMYFLADSPDFTAAVKQGNKQYIDFIMLELAKEYLKRQGDGK